jgi:hypothetical protein
MHIYQPMTPVQAYNLRMALLAAGYIPIPVQGGKPLLSLSGAPSESHVRSWGTRFPDSETGIFVDGALITVTEVPKPARKRVPRAQWLENHPQNRSKPWEKANMSRATWFRRGCPNPAEGHGEGGENSG